MIHSFTIFISSSVHLFIHSKLDTFIHSLVHLLINFFTYLLIYSFIHLLTSLFLHLLLINSLVCSPFHPLFPSCIHCLFPCGHSLGPSLASDTYYSLFPSTAPFQEGQPLSRWGPPVLTPRTFPSLCHPACWTAQACVLVCRGYACHSGTDVLGMTVLTFTL